MGVMRKSFSSIGLKGLDGLVVVLTGGCRMGVITMGRGVGLVLVTFAGTSGFLSWL